VKILFDQNVPRNLRDHLPHHEVLTAAAMGWHELENGDLLNAAESGGFHVFITCDQSLRYQQNLTGRKIAIIELTKNNWPSIKPNLPEIVRTVDKCSAGEYHTIECAFIFTPRRR
jgi:predicted nuclease of predicted toxin-antitoxin system